MSKFTIPDIKNIIQISKQDFDAVTRLVNSMPDNLVDLKQWQLNVRTKLYDVGIMIENLETVIRENVPELSETEKS